MPASNNRRLAKTHSTDALLLARLEQGDSNLVLTFFSEQLGKISALARNARNSRKRFGGALEPMHTLALELDDSGGDLLHLREASLVTARNGLTTHLPSLQAAGTALRWVRHAAPARTPEPQVWRLLQRLLTQLDDPASHANCSILLAEYGLLLLAAFGWGLELQRCVRCGRPCPADKKAFVSAARGGLLCRQCGSARTVLGPALRARMLQACEENPGSLLPEDCSTVLELTEQCLAEHASFVEN